MPVQTKSMANANSTPKTTKRKGSTSTRKGTPTKGTVTRHSDFVNTVYAGMWYNFVYLISSMIASVWNTTLGSFPTIRKITIAKIDTSFDLEEHMYDFKHEHVFQITVSYVLQLLLIKFVLGNWFICFFYVRYPAKILQHLGLAFCYLYMRHTQNLLSKSFRCVHRTYMYVNGQQVPDTTLYPAFSVYQNLPFVIFGNAYNLCFKSCHVVFVFFLLCMFIMFLQYDKIAYCNHGGVLVDVDDEVLEIYSEFELTYELITNFFFHWRNFYHEAPYVQRL
jgi:hypothetical protein